MSKMKKLAALISAVLMTASMTMTAFAAASEEAVLSDEYVEGKIDTENGSYTYDKYPFTELLAMSNEEFIELDSYHGDVPEIDRGGTLGNRCIFHMLNESGDLRYNVKSGYMNEIPHTEKFSWDIGLEKAYYKITAETDEQLEELESFLVDNSQSSSNSIPSFETYNLMVPVDHWDRDEGSVGYRQFLMVGKFHTNFKYALSPEELNDFDIDGFKNDLKEIFGDAIDYEVYEVNWQKGRRLYIDFGLTTDDITQENVIYYSKIYYALTSISPDFILSNKYTSSSSEAEGEKNVLFTSDSDASAEEETTEPASAEETTEPETAAPTAAEEVTTTVEETTTAPDETTETPTQAQQSTGGSGDSSPKTGDAGTAMLAAGMVTLAGVAFALKKREED